MNESKALDGLSALANETRLRLLRDLVRAGDQGLSAGVLAARAAASSSRLSFHLAALENAGLISSQRVSRNIYYRADFESLGRLLGYVMHDCCNGHPTICACSARSVA
jgi:ArsR family transcriptional regulator, arsenate/arsenite/antimonite-responsive transcriptional repressor